MKIINFLILLLAIPPAILSTIQLLNTTLPVVSPIYNSIVQTAADKVKEVTHQGPQASRSTIESAPARAPSSPSVAAEQAAPPTGEASDEVSLRPVHIGIAIVSVLIALLMFLGLTRRAHA